MADFMRAADGAMEEEAGLVVVSTLESLATALIAPTMGAFRLAHPRVEVLLRGEPNVVSLAERKADIALRLVRPAEERVVARRVGVVLHGLYASKEYLARRGRPEAPTRSLAGHDLVGYDPRYDAAPEAAWLNVRADGARFALRTTSAAALVMGVEAGAGLGVMPVLLASPALVQLVGPEVLPQRDVWLVVHEDLTDAPHVRAVVDHLVEVMRRATASAARAVALADRGAELPTAPRERPEPQ
jgi:DNA-binding transcriptional LysR family regulator